MKADVIYVIKFKDGSAWTNGTPVIITVNQDRPTLAILENLNTGDIKKVHSYKLHIWFAEFQTISDEELQIAVFDGTCPSLTGENVEPDGWDSEGMPSILLACGIC